jgi:hypothetical protein
MNGTLPQTPEPADNDTGVGMPLQGQILEFVGDSQDIADDDRRIRHRYPISCKMHLTPIDVTGMPLMDETTIIFGKDLSRTGICFSHDFPLPHRRLVVSLTDPAVGQFIVEAEVAWTRRTLIGLYESGCRLTRKISGPKISMRV